MIGSAQDNTKGIFKCIRDKLNHSNNIIPLLNGASKILNETEKAEMFNEHFSSVFGMQL